MDTAISNPVSTPDSPVRRVLLTGSSGNVGKRVAASLASQFELYCTDLAPGGEGCPHFTAGDLTDFGTVLRLLEGMDAVVHCAAAVRPEITADFPPDQIDHIDATMLAVNPVATYNILEAARRLGLRRFVYVSSLTVVLGDKHLPRYEPGMPVQPTGLYACTKLFGEHLANVYWRYHGLSTICLRLGQPTPIGHERLDDAWTRSRRARSWFIHIDDVARGFSAALTTPTPFGGFNLVSPNDNPRVEWEKTRRMIGYSPQAYFSADSLSFHADGIFPAAPLPLATHD